jgi:hypothetical protein
LDYSLDYIIDDSRRVFKPRSESTLRSTICQCRSEKIQSLVPFRETYPPKGIKIDGLNWAYLTMGRGQEIILFLPFLNELSSIHMSKSHMGGRFHCVIEPFMTPDVQSLGIPV